MLQGLALLITLATFVSSTIIFYCIFKTKKTNSPASSLLSEGWDESTESTSVILEPSQHSLNPEASSFESSTNRDNFVGACKNELRLRKRLFYLQLLFMFKISWVK